MHILGLLDRANSGKLFFAGQNVYELDDAKLAKLRSNEIGFVFQSFNLLARTGTFPLAHGATQRVGRLRAYGNSLVAPQAAEFIRAVMT